MSVQILILKRALAGCEATFPLTLSKLREGAIERVLWHLQSGRSRRGLSCTPTVMDVLLLKTKSATSLSVLPNLLMTDFSGARLPRLPVFQSGLSPRQNSADRHGAPHGQYSSSDEQSWGRLDTPQLRGRVWESPTPGPC